MVTGLIIGIVIVSIGILALILNMWIKQRTHETGILLSIGVSKVKIVAQYILETLMIAVIAFGLSYFSSGAIAQGTSNLLFSQVAETQPIRRWIADDRRKAAPVARDRDYSVREGDTV